VPKTLSPMFHVPHYPGLSKHVSVEEDDLLSDERWVLAACTTVCGYSLRYKELLLARECRPSRPPSLVLLTRASCADGRPIPPLTRSESSNH
jgi:hypothetical protein